MIFGNFHFIPQKIDFVLILQTILICHNFQKISIFVVQSFLFV